MFMYIYIYRSRLPFAIMIVLVLTLLSAWVDIYIYARYAHVLLYGWACCNHCIALQKD